MIREENGKIDVTFLMRKSCQMCHDVKNRISEYMRGNNSINYQVIDLDDHTIEFEKRHSSITPALWVNNRMWFAGGFEIARFDDKLKDLLQKKGDYHE